MQKKSFAARIADFSISRKRNLRLFPRLFSVSRRTSRLLSTTDVPRVFSKYFGFSRFGLLTFQGMFVTMILIVIFVLFEFRLFRDFPPYTESLYVCFPVDIFHLTLVFIGGLRAERSLVSRHGTVSVLSLGGGAGRTMDPSGCEIRSRRRYREPSSRGGILPR